jgi:hypothetical protein
LNEVIGVDIDKVVKKGKKKARKTKGAKILYPREEDS